MTKGDKKRGNREAKKAKKPKEKVSATADSAKKKDVLQIGDRKKG
ncbi:hypothetical protein [uncultured Albimonas sp.]